MKIIIYEGGTLHTITAAIRVFNFILMCQSLKALCKTDTDGKQSRDDAAKRGTIVRTDQGQDSAAHN